VEPETAIRVRPAIAEDGDGITVVYLESAEHHARLDPARYHVPDVERVRAQYRASRDAARDLGRTTLVAELHGAIVGFVDARCGPSPDPMHRGVLLCYVTEIAVSSAHRSQGAGAQLLRAAEEWGRQQGAAFALLEYLAANTRAAEFYQRKMGYTPAAITMIKPLR